MNRYSNAIVLLHWLLAPMILMALFMGNDIAQLSNDLDIKVDRLQVHMAAGVLIGILFAVRLIVKRASSKVLPVSEEGKIANRIASVMHKSMYVLVFLIVLSGLAIAVQIDMAHIVEIGGIIPDKLSSLPPRKAHGALTALLAILIGFHIAAALYHHLIKKDGIFRRIWFGK